MLLVVADAAAQVKHITLRVPDEVSVTPPAQPIYWGGVINDERYIAVSHR